MSQVLCDMCVACGCHKSFHLYNEILGKREFTFMGVMYLGFDGVEQNHK